MTESNDIINSWNANAEAWIETIRNNELESRRLVTSRAIVDAVLDYSPKKALDLGCGEGWLSRTLRKNGVQCWGTDAIATLINEAVKKDGAFYWQLTYEEIAECKHQLPEPFDAIVLNFALFDKEDAEALLAAIPALLSPKGFVFVQTIHPQCMDDPFTSGWREGIWSGMKREFVLPFSWYYRNPFDWIKVFSTTGLFVKEIRETEHPETNDALSNIFILNTSREIKDVYEFDWKNFPGNHFW